MTDARDEAGTGQGGTGQGGTGQGGAENAAERVIARFGGIRPMAAKLGVAVSTVQGWKARGVIPAQRHEQVRSAAAAQGLDVPREDLEAAVPATGAASGEPASGEAASLAAAVPPPPPEGAADDRSAEEGSPETEEGEDGAGTSLETGQSDQAPWRSVGAEGNGRAAQASQSPSETRSGDFGSGSGGNAEPPPVAQAARPSPIPAMLVGAVLTAAGAVVAVLLSDLWMPARESPSASAVAALELRTARLEEQRLETSPEGLRELERALEAMREQIDALNETVGATGEEAGQAQGPSVEDIEALRSVTTQLNERLDAFEAAAGDRTGGLESRLEELGTRIEEVAQSPAEADGQTLARLEGLDGRLEGAAGRIEGLEARLQSALQEFEAARVRVGEETALALAAGQLREAFRTGRPFRTELEGLRRLGSEENGLGAALAPLEPHADAGVPTLAALQASFSDAAARAVTAARAEGAGDEWQALFWNRLSDLVTVRAVGEPQGEDAGSVVARAERRLESEDLPAALQELETLEGAAADAMADWMGRARARLEAEAGLAALGQVTLGRVTQEPVDGGEG